VIEQPSSDDAGQIQVQEAVLGWGRAAGRRLRFRETTDPYRVLVAETMAQQTQVSRVEPAIESFLATFPTVEALAAASAGDVLRAWRGLGYNRRALNLWRAASVIVERHEGVFPRDPLALAGLPGVGPYTARAVAVHAFRARLAPVDTNVRRVLGRFAGRALEGRALQAYADAMVPAEAAAWTNALMDIGALACRPGRPICEACPLAPWCATAKAGAGEPGALSAPRRRASARPRPPSAGQPPSFEQTRRWLRGRILDRLRDAPDGSWAAFEDPLGDHAHDDVVAMLGVLAAEGLLERHRTAPALARLPR